MLSMMKYRIKCLNTILTRFGAQQDFKEVATMLVMRSLTVMEHRILETVLTERRVPTNPV